MYATLKGKKRKWTCIAPIVSISTTKRSDVDHTELPANAPHLPFLCLKKNFLLLSDSYSSLIALGGSHVDQDTIYEILKHTALSQTLVKQSYSAGSPVTWGSLETRELIG